MELHFIKMLRYLMHWNTISANKYMVKVNWRNTRTKCEICSKLTSKTPERRQWCSGDLTGSCFSEFFEGQTILIKLSFMSKVSRNFDIKKICWNANLLMRNFPKSKVAAKFLNCVWLFWNVYSRMLRIN